jgi:hypothetical protein
MDCKLEHFCYRLKLLDTPRNFNTVQKRHLMIYIYEIGMPLLEAIPLILISVLASVPVALPATFTLATATPHLPRDLSISQTRLAPAHLTKRRGVALPAFAARRAALE